MPAHWPRGTTQQHRQIEKLRKDLKLLRSRRSKLQGNKRKFAEVEREIADSLARAHALFQQMSAQASDASMGCVGKAERLCVEMQAKGKEMRAIARMQANVRPSLSSTS